jgi:hypothetical protein
MRCYPGREVTTQIAKNSKSISIPEGTRRLMLACSSQLLYESCQLGQSKNYSKQQNRQQFFELLCRATVRRPSPANSFYLFEN